MFINGTIDKHHQKQMHPKPTISNDKNKNKYVNIKYRNKLENILEKKYINSILCQHTKLLIT